MNKSRRDGGHHTRPVLAMGRARSPAPVKLRHCQGFHYDILPFCRTITSIARPGLNDVNQLTPYEIKNCGAPMHVGENLWRLAPSLITTSRPRVPTVTGGVWGHLKNPFFPRCEGFFIPQPEEFFTSPIRSRPCPGRLFFARVGGVVPKSARISRRIVVTTTSLRCRWLTSCSAP